MCGSSSSASTWQTGKVSGSDMCFLLFSEGRARLRRFRGHSRSTGHRRSLRLGGEGGEGTAHQTCQVALPTRCTSVAFRSVALPVW